MARKRKAKKSAQPAALKKLKAKIVALKKMHKSALKAVCMKAYKEGVAFGKKKAGGSKKERKVGKRKAKKK